MNPNCYVELRKDHFIDLLKEYYKEYLQDKEVLTFGSLCYGVKEANVDVLILE
ncbi:hypothetical protein NGI46_27950 [Peribacillus butanolivorans]|nr:hypothetical protein [Peribacillus butanolivorans]